jgi:hypothetical protein
LPSFKIEIEIEMEMKSPNKEDVRNILHRHGHGDAKSDGFSLQWMAEDATQIVQGKKENSRAILSRMKSFIRKGMKQMPKSKDDDIHLACDLLVIVATVMDEPSHLDLVHEALWTMCYVQKLLDPHDVIVEETLFLCVNTVLSVGVNVPTKQWKPAWKSICRMVMSLPLRLGCQERFIKKMNYCLCHAFSTGIDVNLFGEISKDYCLECAAKNKQCFIHLFACAIETCQHTPRSHEIEMMSSILSNISSFSDKRDTPWVELLHFIAEELWHEFHKTKSAHMRRACANIFLTLQWSAKDFFDEHAKRVPGYECKFAEQLMQLFAHKDFIIVGRTVTHVFEKRSLSFTMHHPFGWALLPVLFDCVIDQRSNIQLRALEASFNVISSFSSLLEITEETSSLVSLPPFSSKNATKEDLDKEEIFWKTKVMKEAFVKTLVPNIEFLMLQSPLDEFYKKKSMDILFEKMFALKIVMKSVSPDICRMHSDHLVPYLKMIVHSENWFKRVLDSIAADSFLTSTLIQSIQRALKDEHVDSKEFYTEIVKEYIQGNPLISKEGIYNAFLEKDDDAAETDELMVNLFERTFAIFSKADSLEEDPKKEWKRAFQILPHLLMRIEKSRANFQLPDFKNLFSKETLVTMFHDEDLIEPLLQIMKELFFAPFHSKSSIDVSKCAIFAQCIVSMYVEEMTTSNQRNLAACAILVPWVHQMLHEAFRIQWKREQADAELLDQASESEIGQKKGRESDGKYMVSLLDERHEDAVWQNLIHEEFEHGILTPFLSITRDICSNFASWLLIHDDDSSDHYGNGSASPKFDFLHALLAASPTTFLKENEKLCPFVMDKWDEMSLSTHLLVVEHCKNALSVSFSAREIEHATPQICFLDIICKSMDCSQFPSVRVKCALMLTSFIQERHIQSSGHIENIIRVWKDVCSTSKTPEFIQASCVLEDFFTFWFQHHAIADLADHILPSILEFLKGGDTASVLVNRLLDDPTDGNVLDCLQHIPPSKASLRTMRRMFLLRNEDGSYDAWKHALIGKPHFRSHLGKSKLGTQMLERIMKMYSISPLEEGMLEETDVALLDKKEMFQSALTRDEEHTLRASLQSK